MHSRHLMLPCVALALSLCSSLSQAGGGAGGGGVRTVSVPHSGAFGVLQAATIYLLLRRRR
jgi:hypothetical protein